MRPVSFCQVVITGGSKGLGFALASEFLSLSDEVVIAARDTSICRAAVQTLQQQHPHSQVFQTVCDVTQADQLQQLGAFAQQNLGRIDIWVNNAGASQLPKAPLADTAPEQIQQIVATNMLGSLLGSQAAIQLMQMQPTGTVVSYCSDTWYSNNEITMQVGTRHCIPTAMVLLSSDKPTW